MTDEQPLPADPPNNDASVEGLTESDLDALLAQASSLADDIAVQVGPESPAPTQTALADEAPGDQPLSGSPQPGDGAGLDAKLTELDALAQTTSTELGGAAPPTDGTPAGADGQPAGEETSAAGVPDFMREFTEPSAEGASGAVSGDTDPHTPNDGGAAKATDTPPTQDDGLDSLENPPAEQVAPESADNAGEDNTVKAPSRFGPLASLLSDRANKAGLVSAELAISALTILDRPFVGMSEKLKRLLGWVAISTTLTALIVLAISIV